jgi:DNA-binding transcriptional LysR family regulator
MDIKRSELSLLISLDTLLDELNVTRAARRLNLTQPTLSGQLARLRDIFGDALLVPAENGRGMVPTERALELRPRLAEALGQLRGALSSSVGFDPATARRSFVVTANDSLFTTLGLGVMTRLTAFANPALRISFINVGEDELVARMERQEIDIALSLAGKIPDALKSRNLLRDRFRVAQRKGHPRGNEPLSLDEYTRVPHVLVSRVGQFESPIDGALARLRRSRSVVATVPSYNQVALVLQSTDCIATLPSRVLDRYAASIDVFDLPIDMPAFDLAMAWHPRHQADAGHAWLRELFVEAAEAA